MISRHLRAAGPIFRFAIWFLLVAVCYRNTLSAFFRQESGWYQFLSHSDQRRHFLTYLLTYRYGGHYTPLAFVGEFELTRLVGPQELFWKWRQVTVLGILATAISGFTSRLARRNRISIVPAEALAGAITALFVFQPRMTDFVAWPFMVMQFGWLLLTVAALAALVQIARGPKHLGWIWMTVACAYGSMHVFGLGIATVAGTGVACLFLLSSDHIKTQASTRRHLTAALALMVVFAAIHGACMYWLRSADSIPTDFQQRIAIKPFLGFTWMYLMTVIRSLMSADPVTADSVRLILSKWPFGFALLIASVFMLIRFFRTMRNSSRPEQRIAVVLHVFSIMAFFTVLLLIIARQHRGGFAGQFVGFLTAPRYLVPVSFTLFGSITSVAITAVRRARLWLSVPLFIGIGITAYAVNQEYATTVWPLDPHSTISHGKAWSLLVETAREARAAGLAVPNVPMGALTGEFSDWDLKLFEPLLRYGLRLPPSEKIEFASWDVFAAGIPEEYAASVPSLRPLVELLNLEPGRAR